jgi:hypothetical protein
MSKLTFANRKAWLKEKEYAGVTLKLVGHWDNIAEFSKAVHALLDGTPRDQLSDRTAKLFVLVFGTDDSKAYLEAKLGEIQDAYRGKAEKERSATTLSFLVSNWVGYVVLWTTDKHEFIAWRWWLREDDGRKVDLVQALGMTT